MYFREHLLAIAEEFNLDFLSEDAKGSKWRFLFKKVPDAGSDRKEQLSAAAPRIKNEVKGIVASWHRVFEEVTKCKLEGKKVAFYGQGTTLMLVLAIVEFPVEQIAGIYDDNPHKVGEVVCGVEVRQPNEEFKRAEAVVLCAGPEGIPFMKRTLRDYSGTIIHL
jgi:hypothetical protein